MLYDHLEMADARPVTEFGRPVTEDVREPSSRRGSLSKCLERFSDLSWFLICMYTFTFLNGINYGNLNVSLTSLEKRFGFSSSQTGIISTSSQIGGLSTVLFVSYFGATCQHRPRILAFGALLCSLSCIFRVLPHILGGEYDFSVGINGEQEDFPTCHVNETDSDCVNSHDGIISSVAFTLLFVGQFVGGAGFSPMVSLAPVLVDLASGGEQTALFVAVNNAMSGVGIATGFISGSLCLSLFVDITRRIHITNTDPRWVGAWWLMFVVSGLLLLVLSLLLFAFPSEVKSKKLRSIELAKTTKANAIVESQKQVVTGFKNTRESEMSVKRNSTKEPEMPVKKKSTGEAEKFVRKKSGVPYSLLTTVVSSHDTSSSFLKQLTSLPKSLLKVLLVPTYTIFTLMSVLELMMLSALSSFGTKMFELNFELTSSQAGLAMGSIATTCGCSASLLSGYLISRWKISTRSMGRLCCVSALLAILYAVGFAFYCDSLTLAGLNVSYGKNSSSVSQFVNLQAQCNQHCSCDLNAYYPVCGQNGITYFSPCHAGCQTIKNVKVFEQCECVQIDNSSSSQHSEWIRTSDVMSSKLQTGNKTSAHDVMSFLTWSGNATGGICNSNGECLGLYKALPFFCIGFVFRTLLLTPLTMIILRSVPEENTALSLGLQWLAGKMFGTIPGPILFGIVIDKTCSIWEASSCQEHGQCWVYNLANLNLYFALLWSGLSGLSGLLAFCGIWVIPASHQQYSHNISNPDVQEMEEYVVDVK